MWKSLVLLVATFAIFKCEEHETTRINFGSCVWPEAPQNIWKAVIDRNPDLWIWTGDATYLDYKNFDMFSDWDVWKQIMVYHFPPGNPNDFKEIWEKTYENSDYKTLEQMCPIIGTWDDHDYGVNNGNHYNPHKKLTQELYLDFLNVPKDSAKRKRDGVYDFYQLNITFPANKSINQPNDIIKRIDIILLDVRSHWGETKGNEYDLLGKEQWLWFENIINNELGGDITIIANGISILSKNKPYCEQWGENHYSQERLLTYLLSNHKANKLFYDHTILLSGDLHWGEISHVTCISEDDDSQFMEKYEKNKEKRKNLLKNLKNKYDNGNINDNEMIDDSELDPPIINKKSKERNLKHHSKYRPTRDLYEIVSSGLTHSLGDDAPPLLRYITKLYHYLETDKISQCLFNNKNFGEIEISWEKVYKNGNSEIIDYKIDDIFLKIFDENGGLQCNVKYPIYDHSLIEYEEEAFLDFKDENRLLYEIDTSNYDGIYSKYHCYSHHPISETQVFINKYILLATFIVALFLPFVFLTSVPCSCYYYYCCIKNKKSTGQNRSNKNQDSRKQQQQQQQQQQQSSGSHHHSGSNRSNRKKKKKM